MKKKMQYQLKFDHINYLNDYISGFNKKKKPKPINRLTAKHLFEDKLGSNLTFICW